jgi:hypothetical protein
MKHKKKHHKKHKKHHKKHHHEDDEDEEEGEEEPKPQRYKMLDTNAEDDVEAKFGILKWAIWLQEHDHPLWKEILLQWSGSLPKSLNAGNSGQSAWRGTPSVSCVQALVQGAGPLQEDFLPQRVVVLLEPYRPLEDAELCLHVVLGIGI